jgi:ribonuclease P protein component
MLPNSHRLRKTREIERVFKEGKGLKEEGLLLRTAKNGLNLSRFAFIAGQKASKKATERNRIKRTLRELIREKKQDIKIGYDIIITALQGSGGKNREETNRILVKLLEKTRLIK